MTILIAITVTVEELRLVTNLKMFCRQNNEEPIRFIIRHRKDIETYHQVKYKGSKYNISSVTNDNVMN